MVVIGGLPEPWDHLFPLVTDYDSRRRLASRSGDAPLDAGTGSIVAAIQRARNVGFDRFFEQSADITHGQALKSTICLWVELERTITLPICRNPVRICQ